MWYNELTAIASENVNNWKHIHYNETLDSLDKSRHVVIFYESFSNGTMEKSALDEANEEALLRALDEYIDADVPTITEDVIRGESVLIVTAIDENGDETAAWLEIVDIAAVLSDYPVLDVDLLSQKEAEQYDEQVAEILENSFEKSTLQSAVSEATHSYYVDEIDSSAVIEIACHEWVNSLDYDVQSKLATALYSADPDLITDVLTISKKEEIVFDLLYDADRSTLEDLQSLISTILQKKAV